MVENTTETESHDAMAHAAINVCDRMTYRWISCLVSYGNAMTGITPIAHNGGIGVVRVSRQKTDCGMAVTAFRVGNDMTFVLACGYCAIVATGARSGYIGMIKAAIGLQFQKMGGVVAVIAFGVRRSMKLGFSDGQLTIVTLTAISKNFLMIDHGDNGKTRRGMAGMALITGSDVLRRFANRRCAVVARDAVINDAGMIELCTCKSAGYVTGATVLVCHNVTDILTNGASCATIMTRVAPFSHNIGIGMIHISVSETNGVMACSAIFVRTQVNRRSRRPSGSNRNIIGVAIMTGLTIAGDARVDESLRCFERGGGSVAEMTILVRR